MDSLKQDSQEKQTGSDDYCEKHNCHKELRGYQWMCDECKKDSDKIYAIKNAHEKLNLPERLKDHTFENYKPVNDESKKALSLCKAFSENYKHFGGLVLLGGVGTGKTHLSVSICKAVCDKGQSAIMTTVSRIIRDVRRSWGSKKATDEWGRVVSEEDIMRNYSQNCNLLVVDEIGSQYGSDSEKVIISEIINDRYNNKLPTIIIGNVTISEAEDYLGVRVVDRIKDNGSIIVFDWESHRKLAK
jgi:DNA replication protein DnaC